MYIVAFILGGILGFIVSLVFFITTFIDLTSSDFKPAIEPVLYTYKGSTYQFIKTVEFKDTVTGEWYEAVLYKSECGLEYVRTSQDFCSKFKKVTDD